MSILNNIFLDTECTISRIFYQLDPNFIVEKNGKIEDIVNNISVIGLQLEKIITYLALHEHIALESLSELPELQKVQQPPSWLRLNVILDNDVKKKQFKSN